MSDRNGRHGARAFAAALEAIKAAHPEIDDETASNQALARVQEAKRTR
jgi:hypothetical protein